MKFKEITEGRTGRPYHAILFMTGKEIRDSGDLLTLDAFRRMRSMSKKLIRIIYTVKGKL